MWWLVYVNKSLGLITTGIQFGVTVMLMVLINVMMTKMMMIVMIMMKKLYKCLHSVEYKRYAYYFAVSAGTATRYGLDGPGFETRWGDIFRTHPDRQGDPSSLLHNKYRVSIPGIKRSRRGAHHTLTTF
jgi:hypothetical protein